LQHPVHTVHTPMLSGAGSRWIAKLLVDIVAMNCADCARLQSWHSRQLASEGW